MTETNTSQTAPGARVAPRILPLEKPYPPESAAFLEGSMPKWAGLDPIRLFRTWGKHPAMALAMKDLGGFILAGGELPAEDREIIILRACARCGAEYEWGIHAVGHGARAGLSEAALAATVHGDGDTGALSPRHRLLLRAVDQLHDGADIDDALWRELAEVYDEKSLMEMILVTGFYHFVSFSARAMRVEHEEWAARFPPGTHDNRRPRPSV